MTITPLFHVTCHHCGAFVGIVGEQISIRCEFVVDLITVGKAMVDAEQAALEAAKCLDDTCADCMHIVYEAQQKERDFQAEKDLS